MKVKQLIEFLEKFDGDLEVEFYDTDCDRVFMQYAEEFTGELSINFGMPSRIESNSQYYREIPKDEN